MHFSEDANKYSNKDFPLQFRRSGINKQRFAIVKSAVNFAMDQALGIRKESKESNLNKLPKECVVFLSNFAECKTALHVA